MKFAEINAKFTQKVAEYMAKGYTINTATMSGSQGEIAKIDLTDGNEIIRVLLNSFHNPCESIENRWYSFSGVSLIVGRVTDKVAPNVPDTWITAWTDNLAILHTEEYFEIGREKRGCSKWYGTKEQTIAQQDKQAERDKVCRVKVTELSEAAKTIVLPFVRRQPKCKGVKASEIEKVTKYHATNRAGEDEVIYAVSVRGKNFKLR